VIYFEKDLDKTILGLSLQPAFTKRGCSLQDDTMKGKQIFLFLKEKFGRYQNCLIFAARSTKRKFIESK
jgi:hypothetical protein